MKVRFYISALGRSPVEKFLEGLERDVQFNFWEAVVRLESGEVFKMPLNRNLSSIIQGLHELRLKNRTGAFRFFYFVKRGHGIYLVHGFKKQSQELLMKVIELVKRRIGEL